MLPSERVRQPAIGAGLWRAAQGRWSSFGAGEKQGIGNPGIELSPGYCSSQAQKLQRRNHPWAGECYPALGTDPGSYREKSRFYHQLSLPAQPWDTVGAPLSAGSGQQPINPRHRNKLGQKTSARPASLTAPGCKSCARRYRLPRAFRAARRSWGSRLKAEMAIGF